MRLALQLQTRPKPATCFLWLSVSGVTGSRGQCAGWMLRAARCVYVYAVLGKNRRSLALCPATVAARLQEKVEAGAFALQSRGKHV